MAALACIFPGQGSQELGMGKIFYDNFATAKEVFQEVDDALNQKLTHIMFGDNAELLTSTENAQPAIMATSMAMVRVLQKDAGFTLAHEARFVAGHSLGEYSALCAAGALSLADTARLLKLRGKAMQDAAPKGFGTMAAILGLGIEQVETLVTDVAEHGICEVANDNAPGQVVISGQREAVEAALVLAKERGAKRAIELNVSAPFHSSIIADAAIAMRDALAQTMMHAPALPLIANITASQTQNADDIKVLLERQVTGRVRWRESILTMVQAGVDTTLEIGHGKVLSGLNKRIHTDLTSRNISSPDDIELLHKAA
jgi:[acyl-carrier-protein] S-malonyltransferase